MLKVTGDRVTDPETLSPSELVAICEARGHLLIQFSRPESYTAAVLRGVNEACRVVEDRLQVRFFGHYGTRFDAGLLEHLPEVRNLSVDCLSEIIHEEAIGRLPKLRQLAFGVFELNRPDFLETLELERLERVALFENRGRNIVLSPLARCGSLSELMVEGHSQGIDAIANLPSLRRMTLRSFGKAHGLGFIASLPNLKDLALGLGGRSDIADLSSRSLEILKILRVRGLTTVGDLSRTPALSSLCIEDQPQVSELDLRGVQMERLWLNNCRNLRELIGLDAQSRIRQFFASRVSLDLDALRDRDWPAAAYSVRLHSGRRRWDDAAEAQLATRGLGAPVGFWPFLE